MRVLLVSSVLLLGCKHRPPEPIDDPPPAAPMTVEERIQQPWVEDDWSAAPLDPKLSHAEAIVVPPADYVCDLTQPQSLCREVKGGSSMILRQGLDAFVSRCEDIDHGRFGQGVGGATCPDNYFASCVSPGGLVVTRFYEFGGTPWNTASAQEKCKTLGVWTPIR